MNRNIYRANIPRFFALARVAPILPFFIFYSLSLEVLKMTHEFVPDRCFFGSSPPRGPGGSAATATVAPAAVTATLRRNRVRTRMGTEFEDENAKEKLRAMLNKQFGIGEVSVAPSLSVPLALWWPP